ncbi:metal ABC transporter substrate-binding protein [Accumulibacter sp.]|uniref:metal ABC transporter substrate-binding protein n=1 Tax=Accumulibacter sp. TaxID=2053492 RepID=UPI00260C2619|nr:metal ABC transporter substrate-binding protein [Accumulibacter sp.]
MHGVLELTGRRLLAIARWAVVVVALSGPVAAGESLPVVASFSILGDLTRQIGGERVEVHSLIGAGADAHVYQPTPGDARKLAGARLLVVNGLGFDVWIDRLRQSAGYRGKVVVASQGINAIRPGPGGQVDPHAWQDVANTRRYVDIIAEALADLDPTGRPLYQANAARLNKALATLDSEIRSAFAALPPERRKVVSSHDAFAYFGRAYGIRFIAPVGISTDAEPSAADVAAIIRQIRREKIRAMFIENITDPRLLERIARESGARLGGTLYSDSLAKAGSPADNYLGMMRENARTIRAALAD